MTVYKSECGKYICRAVGCWGNFEAWSEDGCIHWRHDNRIKTWQDAARYRRPLVYCIGAYSAEKTGQKAGSFTLSLMHCDVTKEIVPFKGNTILESFDVVFRRKIPQQNTPRWFKNQYPEGGGESL